jgi:PAS domain S-box-containing protein
MLDTTPQAPAPLRRSRGSLAVILVGLSCALFLMVWSEIETRARQRAVSAVFDAQGGALVEALGHAVEHALLSGREVEELATARLLDDALLLDRLEAAGSLDPRSLRGLVAQLGLRRVIVFDGSLRTVLDSASSQAQGPALDESVRTALRDLAAGRADEEILGQREDPEGGGTIHAAAVRRTRGGAVLVSMDSREMLSFQESVGPKNLMDAVAGTGGILYATLEGDAGEAIAGKPPTPAGAPAGVLELERPITLRGGARGVLRIGLSTEAVDAARRAGRRRTAITALAVLALSSTAAGFVMARRRAAALRGEVQRARSLTDAVLEGMDDAVISMDTDGIVRLVNPAACRLLVRPAEELLGRPCASTPCKALGAVPADGIPRELALPRGDGSTVATMVTSSPVRDEAGGRSGVALVLRDLTELRRLEREARRTESLAAFGRLAASVAHEIRNPLNAISVGVQRLQRELPAGSEPGEHGRLTGLLRSEIERLDGIVGRFLDLSRPPQLEIRPGDLDATVHEVVDLLRAAAPPEVRIVERLGGPPPVQFDPKAVRQIVHNLVRNALEAMGARGTATCTTRAAGASASLEVSDDGPGIPPADLERIFEFGFSTKPHGNGLGLPIVHRLVTEMGGSVSIDSEPGRGTAVRVLLPLAPPRPA